MKNLDPYIVEINRFTRLVFGLTQSSFIFEGALKKRFKTIVIQKVQNDIYVDESVLEGTDLNQFNVSCVI